MLNKALLVLGFVAFVPYQAHALVYDVDLDIGAGSVTGYIETDGSLGFIDNTSILDFEFLVTTPAGGADSIVKNIDSVFDIAGNSLFATPGALAYSAVGDGAVVSVRSDGSTLTYFLIQPDFDPTTDFAAFSIVSNADPTDPTVVPESVAFESAALVGVAREAVVPLPATAMLVMVGFGALGAVRLRRSRPA